MNWFYADLRCDPVEGDILELWFVGFVVNDILLGFIMSNRCFSVLP
jgi:hypothetical protein